MKYKHYTVERGGRFCNTQGGVLYLEYIVEPLNNESVGSADLFFIVQKFSLLRGTNRKAWNGNIGHYERFSLLGSSLKLKSMFIIIS